jgi:hypothetical protein
MKINTLVCSLFLISTTTLLAQTADTYVTQGRDYLASANLAAANRSFSNAVAVADSHQTANVFYAFTRLLVLPNRPNGSNFLNRIGIPLAGRDIYNWSAKPPTDADRVPVVPEGLNANEFTAFIRSTALPEMVAAGSNLTKVSDTNFVLQITAAETRGTSVILDYGDIQMLRAILHAFEYFGYTIHSWNADLQMAAVRSLYSTDQLSIQRLLTDYPGLMTFATTNELSDARSAFINAVDTYLRASDFIRNRSNTTSTFLFNIDLGSLKSEKKFRLTLIDLKNSLNGAVPLSVKDGYTVFMAPQFDGKHNPRSFLPEITPQGFIIGTLPEPMFGGSITGLSPYSLEQNMSKFMSPVPTLLMPGRDVRQNIHFPVNGLYGRGYVVQVSANLLSWEDYAAFFGWDEPYDFVDTDSQGAAQRFYRVVDRTTDMPPPINDSFSNSIKLTGWGITAYGYNVYDPMSWGNDSTSWWSWTASDSGPVVVVTSGSAPWIDAWIYTGSSQSTLQWVASGNVPFVAVAGTTYHISVDSPPGSIKLTITSPPAQF